RRHALEPGNEQDADRVWGALASARVIDPRVPLTRLMNRTAARDLGSWKIPTTSAEERVVQAFAVTGGRAGSGVRQRAARLAAQKIDLVLSRSLTDWGYRALHELHWVVEYPARVRGVAIDRPRLAAALAMAVADSARSSFIASDMVYVDRQQRLKDLVT